MGVIVAWALLSWIPVPLPAFIVKMLNVLTWPVWQLFGWAQIGPLGLAPALALLLLYFLENYLRRFDPAAQAQQEQRREHAERERQEHHEPPRDEMW
jgi:hypothetical protein